MSIKHIASSVRRQRMMPILLIAQVALTCAILGNTLFLLGQRLAPMLVPDGIVRDEVLVVDQVVSTEGNWKSTDVRAARMALASIPGVRVVSQSLGVPMRQTFNLAFSLEGPTGVSLIASGFAGDHLIQALGLQLEAGRDFTAEEGVDIFGGDKDNAPPMPVIMTRALADRLFPDGGALGSVLSDPDGDSSGYRVVGIVRHLLRYQMSELDDGKSEYSMLVPTHDAGTPILSYVLRTDPDRRESVKQAIPDVLKRSFGQRIMRGIEPAVATYEDLRALGFKSRRASVWLLAVVNLVVATITAIGIASLTGYWIAQRTRQIGVRRALGATRGQILRDFLLENFLLVSAGLVLGMGLAYGTNQLLMAHYALPRLPLGYLPIGAALLWALGQFAVFWPARRAAAIEPAIATRGA
ncbi:ABC transporter permease [Pseudoxanthomonas spadix]|uniref:ABC transporter permease n=1 Tax=Pseudoxanthomonas spadix TaxID=415229 RepID=UPI000F0036C1|nr:FtsX-like permease family protein [Pseudoxanthomonas spadix]MBP3973093.1 FtsX-like permease family protein [Pseudoxanthomonas spadix]RMW97234.1 FtsX-like permease family protein [Pseudoxanthomonas spadix]